MPLEEPLMDLTLAVPLGDKIAAEFAGIHEHLSRAVPATWVPPAALVIHLGWMRADDVESHRAHVAWALDKATAAQQGFKVTLAGLRFERGFGGRGVVAGLGVAGKAGMLQSVTFSFADRAAGVARLRYDEPWRPLVVLGRIETGLDEVRRLELEAAAHGKSWLVPVKSLALYRLLDDGSREEILSANLPAAGA
jgi:hypothetical protein